MISYLEFEHIIDINRELSSFEFLEKSVQNITLNPDNIFPDNIFNEFYNKDSDNMDMENINIYNEFIISFSIFIKYHSNKKIKCLKYYNKQFNDILNYCNMLKDCIIKDAKFHFDYQKFLTSLANQNDAYPINTELASMNSLIEHINLYDWGLNDDEMKSIQKIKKLLTIISSRMNGDIISSVLPAFFFDLLNIDYRSISGDNNISEANDLYYIKLFNTICSNSNTVNINIVKKYQSSKAYLLSLKNKDTDYILNLYKSKNRDWFFLLFLLLDDKKYPPRKTPSKRLRYELFSIIMDEKNNIFRKNDSKIIQIPYNSSFCISDNEDMQLLLDYVYETGVYYNGTRKKFKVNSKWIYDSLSWLIEDSSIYNKSIGAFMINNMTRWIDLILFANGLRLELTQISGLITKKYILEQKYYLKKDYYLLLTYCSNIINELIYGLTINNNFEESNETLQYRDTIADLLNKTISMNSIDKIDPKHVAALSCVTLSEEAQDSDFY